MPPTSSELGRRPPRPLVGVDGMALLPMLGLFADPTPAPVEVFPKEYREGFIPPTGEDTRPEGEAGGRNEEL